MNCLVNTFSLRLTDINRAISAIRQTENTNKFFKPMKIKQVSEHALFRFGVVP